MKPTDLTDQQAERCFELAMGHTVHDARYADYRTRNEPLFERVSVVAHSVDTDTDFESYRTLCINYDGTMSSTHWLKSMGYIPSVIDAAAVVDYLRSL